MDGEGERGAGQPPRAPAALGLLALAAAALAARGPLHAVTFDLPVSNDDAILLLMARHLLGGELFTTLWNQPYNGALDAYLLAPFVAVFGHHHGFRLYEALCAALLVACVGLLGRRLGGAAAGWAAALLAAWGTPYMALMTATGPPPNFLMPLVTGFPLVVLLGRGGADAAPLRSGAAFGLGLVAGLAVWNSSLAIPAFLGMGAGLLAAGWRPGARASAAGVLGLLVGASPLFVARLLGAAGASVVTAASAVTAIRPRWLWASGVSDLAQALVSLFGFRVPLVVDGPEKGTLPAAAMVALGLGLGVVLLLGATRSRRVLPLVGWALALAGAFALSRRTNADELRYLYGLFAPVLALCGVGLGRLYARHRALGAAAAMLVLVPWGLGHRVLARAWSDPAHAVRVWQVPDVTPALAALERAGVESAYASLQFAGRLTLESGGGVVASQAWNERIPGDPLRFRDEVDLDPRPAWVLSPVLSRGMPRAPRFRDLVRETGGEAVVEEAGDLVVFRAFRPPYDETRPVPVAALRASYGGRDLPAAVYDRDPRTTFAAADGLHRGARLEVRLEPARRLSALVLAVDLLASPLAAPWIAEAGGEVVARGPARHGLQWVGGAPRAGRQALLAVPLGGVTAGEVVVVFQGPGPRLVLSEVFAYGPDEPARPPAGAAAAERAFRAARRGEWDAALAAYAEAVAKEPERAGFHAAWARAAWRAPRRRVLDVEGLDDGGPDLVSPR